MDGGRGERLQFEFAPSPGPCIGSLGLVGGIWSMGIEVL